MLFIAFCIYTHINGNLNENDSATVRGKRQECEIYWCGRREPPHTLIIFYGTVLFCACRSIEKERWFFVIFDIYLLLLFFFMYFLHENQINPERFCSLFSCRRRFIWRKFPYSARINSMMGFYWNSKTYPPSIARFSNVCWNILKRISSLISSAIQKFVDCHFSLSLSLTLITVVLITAQVTLLVLAIFRPHFNHPSIKLDCVQYMYIYIVELIFLYHNWIFLTKSFQNSG